MSVDNTTPVPGQRDASEFYEDVNVDADIINSRVNYHGKCRPGTCRSRYDKCTTCRSGVLKRASECTKCSDLTPSSYVPGKVVARTTIRPPLIQDERWPLTQDDPRALVVDIRRRTEEDLMQIEASRVVASAIRFNTPLRTITDTVRRRTHQWRYLPS